jgi:hypothetical protein
MRHPRLLRLLPELLIYGCAAAAGLGLVSEVAHLDQNGRQVPAAPRLVVLDDSGAPAHQVTVWVDGFPAAIRTTTVPVMGPLTPVPPNPNPVPPNPIPPNPNPVPPDPVPPKPDPRPRPVNPDSSEFNSNSGLSRVVARGWDEVVLVYAEKSRQGLAAAQSLERVTADANKYLVPNGMGKGHDKMADLIRDGFAALDSAAQPTEWAPCIGKAKLTISDQLAANEYADADGYADALALIEAFDDVVIGLRRCVQQSAPAATGARR